MICRLFLQNIAHLQANVFLFSTPQLWHDFGRHPFIAKSSVRIRCTELQVTPNSSTISSMVHRLTSLTTAHTPSTFCHNFWNRKTTHTLQFSSQHCLFKLFSTTKKFLQHLLWAKGKISSLQTVQGNHLLQKTPITRSSCQYRTSVANSLNFLWRRHSPYWLNNVHSMHSPWQNSVQEKLWTAK